MAAKATGPLGSLNEESTSYLIELFQSHQELWDPRREKYRNRPFKTALWHSLLTSFEKTTGIKCTVDNIQAKVVSLRNTFSREMRKINKTKVSGAGACDVYNSTWPFFQQMKFLLPVMSLVAPTSTNLETQVVNHQQQSEGDHFNQSQIEEEVTETQSEEGKENDPAFSLTSSLCGSRSDSDAGKRPEKRRRKDQGDDLTKCVIEYYKNKSSPKEDSELIWARNLAQRISEIPDITQRKLIKIDIDEQVLKALRQSLAKND